MRHLPGQPEQATVSNLALVVTDPIRQATLEHDHDLIFVVVDVQRRAPFAKDALENRHPTVGLPPSHSKHQDAPPTEVEFVKRGTGCEDVAAAAEGHGHDYG